MSTDRQRMGLDPLTPEQEQQRAVAVAEAKAVAARARADEDAHQADRRRIGGLFGRPPGTLRRLDNVRLPG